MRHRRLAKKNIIIDQLWDAVENLEKSVPGDEFAGYFQHLLDVAEDLNDVDLEEAIEGVYESLPSNEFRKWITELQIILSTLEERFGSFMRRKL